MLLWQFKGEKAVDPVTGKPTLYFPEREYFMRLAFRYCTLLAHLSCLAVRLTV